MTDEDRARLAVIDAKLDRLLARDADEAVVGVLGALRRWLDNGWVRAAVVVAALAFLGRSGMLSAGQQQALVEAALGGLPAAPAAPSTPTPEATPALPVTVDVPKGGEAPEP